MHIQLSTPGPVAMVADHCGKPISKATSIEIEIHLNANIAFHEWELSRVY